MPRLALPAIVASASLFLAACTPTPPAGGGGVNTGCAFSLNQTSQDLRMTCTVTGSPANTRINPVSGGSSCAIDSLSLFAQSVSVTNATFIWGENGDDSPSRVRIGAIVPDGSTHAGRLAKSAPPDCASTTGPVATVATSFGGRHIAIIDRTQTPFCVYQSRFQPSSFTQTITAGLTVDPSVATRAATIDAIARQLDLEAASAVNRLVGDASSMDAAYRSRSGRCTNGYAPFTGN